MYKRYIILFSFFMSSIFAIMAQSIDNNEDLINLGIIPAPNNIFLKNENSDINTVNIFINNEVDINFFQQLFKETKGITLVKKESSNVHLLHFAELEKEGYRLDIQQNKIEISTSSPTGLQYALVSLTQLVKHHGFPLPQVIIEDSPKFAYRGMHLDVARHFFKVSDVKKYLDYMAYYKFNNFHWHLTDDQGWRIEIKKYPKLQEVAAYRKETLIGHYNDQPHQYDGQRYGAFYTQNEVEDIVAYAAARNINVIPEIEMPGHAQAALSAYPELGCENKQYEAATKWGIFEDVFCPNEVTFKFLEDVIDEVVTLFPGKYIHVGGDECPKEVWKKSAFCQELIKKENLKDEHGLQSYFIQRMEKYINAKGKQIIGWDEILEGGLAPNATVMSWRGIQGGMEAARQNHDVIMTPGTHCYFDHYQSDSADEPIAIGGLTTLEKVYGWEPIPETLELEKRKYILGGQSNLWSEYIKEYTGVEYMVYARGIAMAEALWSRQKDFSKFLNRYENHNDYWKNRGANMAFHVYDLIPKIKAGEGKPISVSFDMPQNYTLNYFHKDRGSIILFQKDPIVIKTSGNHTFRATKGNKEGRPLKIDFDLHKGTTASIQLKNNPAKQYSGNGSGSIINGVKGNDNKYGGSEWLGFAGSDCIATLDFGNITELNEITFRFFKGEGQWIYLPKNIEILTSNNGIDFKSIHKISDISTKTKIATISQSFKNLQTRYLKFSIANYGEIPTGKQGAGHKAWLFLDEVVIR